MRQEPGGTLSDRIECDLAEFGGVWFPRRVLFRRYLNDELVFTDDARVEEARFNFDLPQSTFELQGMNLALGTAVHDHVSKPTRVLRWNGEQAVVAGAVNPPPELVGRGWLLPLIIAANLVAGLGLLAYYLLRRRGSQPRS